MIRISKVILAVIYFEDWQEKCEMGGMRAWLNLVYNTPADISSSELRRRQLGNNRRRTVLVIATL